jgi:hypothetical protein
VRSTDPYQTLEPGPLHDEWVRQMKPLNSARVRLGMAISYLVLRSLSDDNKRDDSSERPDPEHLYTARMPTTCPHFLPSILHCIDLDLRNAALVLRSSSGDKREGGSGIAQERSVRDAEASESTSSTR